MNSYAEYAKINKMVYYGINYSKSTQVSIVFSSLGIYNILRVV